MIDTRYSRALGAAEACLSIVKMECGPLPRRVTPLGEVAAVLMRERLDRIAGYVAEAEAYIARLTGRQSIDAGLPAPDEARGPRP